MTETRRCEQCGAEFQPRREHARFCSADCRVAWTKEHIGDPDVAQNALDWSLGAMREAAGRLTRTETLESARVAMAVSEAVWWVTIVDATLVRYYPDTYDDVLAGMTEECGARIEEFLAGLRYVRNQLGVHLDPGEFIRPDAAGWTWRSLPEPPCASLSPRGQDWELSRYRAYQSRLAGAPVAETVTTATTFLSRTASAALPVP
ncbi:MAG TPA: hypothetical protein VFB06_29935 [Streptosporangiaceae bacterium]|nr:hypothetical protein [Streptosporangiaceae bacterium]